MSSHTARARAACALLAIISFINYSVKITDDSSASPQARDILTYSTRSCTQHAFRRYCFKRLEALRQQVAYCLVKSAPAAAAPAAAAPTASSSASASYVLK
jgi:hypothetical protein